MKVYKIIVLSLIITLTNSCSDFLDLAPYDQISSGNMWLTESLADKGVTGVYQVLRLEKVAADGYFFEAWGVSGDYRTSPEGFLRGTETTGGSIFSTVWKNHYEGISRANDAIANLHKANLSEEKYGRLIAEVKFLRAFFYYKLNMLYRGVPLYLEPIEVENATKGRETEQKIWEAVVTDLTDCINEPNLPDRYSSGDANFGRVTKAATYALRGKVYLWMKDWPKAEQDFKKVGELGCELFQGGYRELFKEANEQCPEMIFSVQNISISGLGNNLSKMYGTRTTFNNSGWNDYIPNTDFVDSYTWQNGKEFNWNDVIPGYNEMSAERRAIFFCRNNMTEAEKNAMEAAGADISQYKPTENEERIRDAYEGRDPRLEASIITPYSTYLGSYDGEEHNYTYRYPLRGSGSTEPYDLQPSNNTRITYFYRKFVAEGSGELVDREYGPIDFPIIRYADVLLGLAEAVNEQGEDRLQEAVGYVNEVRERAGVALLNSNDYTQVTDQENLRERIRNERRWEFVGEGVSYYDEIRWQTWKDSKFFGGAGFKYLWGQAEYYYSWNDKQNYYQWPVPRSEREMNSNLEQSEGWID